ACLLPVILVAAAQQRTAKTVEAEKFVLVDSQGRTRAELGVKDGRTALLFSDENDVGRLVLVASADRAGLYLLDSDANPRGFLAIAQNKPALILQDEKGKGGIALHTSPDRAELTICDEAGATRVQLSGKKD